MPVYHKIDVRVGSLMERNIRQAIIDTLDQVAPGWNFIPDEERADIVFILRKLAIEMKNKRGFMNDRAIV